MRFHRLPLALLFASSLSLNAAQDASPTSGKSSWGVWHSIVGGLKTATDGATKVGKKTYGIVGKLFSFSSHKRSDLRLDLVCASNPVRLGRDSSVAVNLQLFNSGKKTHLLEFTSGQRAEVVLRDTAGRIVGRSLSAAGEEAGLATLNPGERIEFALQLPTKELVVGKSYLLEAAMTGQPGLLARLPLSVTR